METWSLPSIATLNTVLKPSDNNFIIASYALESPLKPHQRIWTGRWRSAAVVTLLRHLAHQLTWHPGQLSRFALWMGNGTHTLLDWTGRADKPSIQTTVTEVLQGDDNGMKLQPVEIWLDATKSKCRIRVNRTATASLYPTNGSINNLINTNAIADWNICSLYTILSNNGTPPQLYMPIILHGLIISNVLAVKTEQACVQKHLFLIPTLEKCNFWQKIFLKFLATDMSIGHIVAAGNPLEKPTFQKSYIHPMELNITEARFLCNTIGAVQLQSKLFA